MPTISVVLPILIRTPKQLAMTQRCISLARACTQHPFELIIVESGSTYFLDEADVYIHEKTPTTPEIAHNLGFQVARRKNFVVLLTNDVYVSDNWLEVLVSTFAHRDDCGLATLGTVLKGHKKEDRIEEGNWFDVAMIRREVFERIGFYDERFHGSFPDTDFLVRAYKEGWKMYRNYNCIVSGEPPHQTVHQNPNFQANYERGRALFQQKHAGCNLAVYEAYK